MDQSNGLEAKISQDDILITIKMDLQEKLLHLIKIFLQGATLHMGTTTRTTEDHMINAQIIRSIETMEIDLEMNLSTTRMGTGETMKIFLVLHRLKEETSHKITLIANQEMINLTSLRSADLTIDLRLVLCPTNKSFLRTIIRHHLMWFASPQPMIPLTNVGSLPVKLLRYANSNTNKSRNSRLSLNIFYFATGVTQKFGGLEIEYMLDTGASCSIINYRTFSQFCQLQHTITPEKVPM